jgi:hypothetical protein
MAVTALADAKNVSEASIKKMSDPSTAGTIIGRTAAQSMYVMGSQNLLLNIVLESMKASHVDKNSDTYKAIEMVTMVIQSLLMIVAGGSMMSGQVSEEGLPQLFSQITNAANTISLAVNGVGEGSLASVEEQQARVIPKLTQDQAAQQGFHFLLKRIFEEQRSEFDAYIQEASKTSQSNSRMASKLESMEVAADLQRVLQVTV